VRWDLYEKCVKWAGALYDEDARRDVALQVLEEVGDRELTETEIKHRVRWRALNELKRIQKRPTTLGGDALQLAEVQPSDEATPDEALFAKRGREQLCEQLGTEQVEFLECSAEFSDKDIARATGESETNLRKRRSRLRRKAKEILDGNRE